MLKEGYKICGPKEDTFNILDINHALEKCKISILHFTTHYSKIQNSLKGLNLKQSAQW